MLTEVPSAPVGWKLDNLKRKFASDIKISKMKMFTEKLQAADNFDDIDKIISHDLFKGCHLESTIESAKLRVAQSKLEDVEDADLNDLLFDLAFQGVYDKEQ